MPLTRRTFLALSVSVGLGTALSACGGGAADIVTGATTPTQPGKDTPETATPGAMDPTLDQFMQLSAAITGFDDLSDADAAELYFTALSSDPQLGPLLQRLWTEGRFDVEEMVTVEDLEAAEVYDDPDLALLAGTITDYWYSGVYVAQSGEPAVATYANALAWRSLGYRQAGPTTCGGAFGHWSTEPANG